ncbi:hypothetical protein [Hoyosella subflava]|uniref:Uncharacterized protein n=1 Tax=Hoyosella subflava (strain DSM 45089 / JCM 17490 / NBRC 109087 / DQS3-9A1) TaxID=443218 RepID=F6EI95_HOYSD|nr:hypothetical protein [Hoyosella subflava]AEF41202.1 hypothetical protein AS9A_2755 [Hoyosella subflava DQS3-9A1]
MSDRRTGARPFADTPTLVGLRTRGAIIIAVAWTITEALRATVTDAAGREPGWWGVSIAVIAVATGLLLRASRDPVPLRASLAIAILPAVAAVANIAMMGQPSGFGLYAAWTWPTGTIIMCFLVLRGRPILAWVGEVLLSSVILWWWNQAPVASNVTEAWQECWWNISFLGTCTVLGVAMRYQVGIINELRDTTASVGVDQALAEARTAERDRQLVYLNATARPLLEKILQAETLSDADLTEIALVEAQLRDRIRARGLASESLLDAARDARARGATVVLLDDGALDGLSEPDREAAQSRIAKALHTELDRATADSTVTARILPPGRPTLATVLRLSAHGVRRHEIGAER